MDGVRGLHGGGTAAATVLMVVAVSGSVAAQQPKTEPPAPVAAAPISAPQASNQCATAYHQALDPLRRDRAPALGNLITKLRAAESDLPGRWLFSAQLFQKANPRQAKAERICIETADVKGQARCVRYGIKPAQPATGLSTRSAPNAEELRQLKALSEIVTTRVSVPDIAANGKQTFLVQRLSQDLRLYVSQPVTPVLCAGAGELTEFYAGQLVSIRRRHEELKAAAKKLAELAAVRTREIAVTEGRLFDAAVAAAKAIADTRAKIEQTHAAAVATQAQQTAAAPAGTPLPAPLAAPNLPAIPLLPPKPAAPANLADYAVTSLPAQIGEALRPLLPQAVVAEIVLERDAFAMLARAQKAILDPEVKTESPAAPDVRDAAITALRLHEGRLYADRYAARYGEIDTLLAATLAEIKSAHGKSCTCQD